MCFRNRSGACQHQASHGYRVSHLGLLSTRGGGKARQRGRVAATLRSAPSWNRPPSLLPSEPTRPMVLASLSPVQAMRNNPTGLLVEVSTSDHSSGPVDSATDLARAMP